MSTESIISTQDSMMEKLLEFYNEKKNIDILVKFIDGKNGATDDESSKKSSKIPKKEPKLSLRLLNWFCTNYAKQYNVAYFIKKRNKQYLFNVYTEYKIRAGSESKKYFDPFRRGGSNNNKIIIEYNENGETKTLKTTTAQLNFFEWIISNNVLNYIEKHLKEIYDDQILRFNKNKGTGQKKKQISDNINKKLIIIEK